MQGEDKNPRQFEGLKKPSHLEDLEESIYRRDKAIPRLRREELHERPHAMPPSEWKHNEEEIETEVHAVRSSFFKNMFLVSLAFFLIAAGFGAYVIFGGGDTVSSKNVDVTVAGPVSIAAGSPLELQVLVKNNNLAAIQNAALVVEYPDGTKSTIDPTKDLSYEKDSLGTLAPGNSTTQTIRGLLYGETNSTAHLKLTVEYNLAGSNTLFYADSGYDVQISSSPISIVVTALDEVTSGQQQDIKVDVVSNSTSLLRDIVLKATYPFGFVTGDSTPAPASGNSVWQIGDMNPGDKRTIHIIGTLSAQDGEARVFKFQVGTASDADATSIGTSFLSVDKQVTVKKPFLGLVVALNGQDAESYAASAGSTVHAVISWVNNTDSEIDNAAITAKLIGTIFDRQTITAPSGYYRSSDGTITWDSTLLPELAKIPAGATGQVAFDWATIPLSGQSGSVSQPQVSFNVSVSGKRLGATSVQENVSSSISRTVKYSSKAVLYSRMFYSVGPFHNTGSIPPKADTKMTYTVVWDIVNTSNQLNGAVVKATLPSYVDWLGVSVPAGEHISFDSTSRQITWNAGSIAQDAGAVVGKRPREIAFQVSYLPSVSQVGTVPEIVSDSTLDATDSWSGAPIHATRPALTTNISSDPIFQTGQGEVVN